jgi:hypothetical protein
MLNYAGGTPVTAYNLTRSLRFRSAATAWLGRTPATATNQTTWTWSGWVKRGVLSSGTIQTLFNASVDANNFTELRFTDTSNGVFQFTYVVAGVDTAGLTTTQVFRDSSAYYHIALAVDTTQATAANRLKLYVNGAQVTAFSAATYPLLNATLWVNSVNFHGLGITRAVGRYYDGYMAEVNFVDGQALTPSSFGSTSATTGVWQPAKYTGTYGTNGFYLPFTDNSALTTSSNVGLGKDFSGNGNYWTTNNISITVGVTYDSMTDVPTLTSATAANFPVLNTLVPNFAGAPIYRDGNLYVNCSSAANFTAVPATMSMPTSGKWYAEFFAVYGDAATSIMDMGLVGVNTFPLPSNVIGTTATSYNYRSSGNKLNNNVSTAYGATYGTGDLIAIAFDATAGSLTFYKNNVSQGVAFTGLTAEYSFAVGGFNAAQWQCNFGQRPFTYTPPTGFVALNTYNLPTSTILQGNKVMDATLYTGTLLSNAITNAAGFKPDLVWLKSRSAVTDNKLTDSVRGVTKGLVSNNAGAETTDVQGLTAFNSNGFTVGTDVNYNNLAATYVAWQWQAGQGSSGANTNGTITSTVSVNASAGFSVVTYTGSGVNATVGHGLGVAPSLIIVKIRSTLADWYVYHISTGNTSNLYLNSTSGVVSSATVWNNTSPTSSVFSVGTAGAVNGSGATFVAYCWAPIAGFSSFGSYIGNANAAGPFVYTGFRPKFVLVKCNTTSNSWIIWDGARTPYNQESLSLLTDTSGAEISNTDLSIDALSNGFKLRGPNANSNASGAGFIYMAFAENPFKNSLAR